MPAPAPYLFVYGTLRRAFGHPMARLLPSNGRYIGDGVLDGLLYDVGAYPAAVAAEPGTGGVIGEVHVLERSRLVFRALDRFEGCAPEDPQPHLYVRQERDVRLDGGTSLTAWVYLYNRETGPLLQIPDGDYVRYRLGGCRRRSARPGPDARTIVPNLRGP